MGCGNQSATGISRYYSAANHPPLHASDYCFDKEMQRAMERHAAGTARVIPIIMKPCDWQDTAFSKLQGYLKMLNRHVLERPG
jgi:hypothetical protein